MNEKFNKNAKVEKFTTMLGIAVRLIVIDPSSIFGNVVRIGLPNNNSAGILPVVCGEERYITR